MNLPIFAGVFGDTWDDLPPVLKTHYANRPFCRDRVTVEGQLDIRMGPLMRVIAPVMAALGMLTPRGGEAVGCTVHFLSDPDSDAFIFERHFRFPGRKPHVFRSKLVTKGPNDVIEYMACGVAWRSHYSYAGGRITLSHKGYLWRVFGIDIPLPWLGELLLGRGDAFEQALDDRRFAMRMGTTGGLFGAWMTYAYSGEFTVTHISLDV